MRLKLLFLLCTFSFFGFSQEEENSIYYPQEILIHPDCENVEDKNSCLKNIIQNDLSDILIKKINQSGIEKDTIKASIYLDLDSNGVPKEDSSTPFIQDSTFRNQLSDDLKEFNKRLPKFKFLNKKPKTYNVTHSVFFSFLVHKYKDSFALSPISTDRNAYRGGDILEVPVFPGCDISVDQNMRLCFNKKMQTHISQNFRYPRKAQKKKQQGKVHIMFDISSKGFIENIRTRGPYQILENEAVRIIKLLPKMQPGKKNGKPIKTPFAIPLTFKLR